MRRTLLLASVLVLILVASGVATAGETFRRVLPENGLTVVLRENHASPVVNLRVYVKAGSIYEEEYLGAGISHYCEHLLSDGTTTRTLEEIEQAVDAIGGGSNAYTTKDHTCYFIETSSEHFDRALDILSDEAMNATMPQDAVDAQHGVIVREINMGYDEPGRRLYNLFGEVMYRRHPARFPVIGYVENFERLTREDVLTYKDRMYVPNNMVFVAVGDFDTEEAFRKIRNAFADFERKPFRLPALPEEPKPQGMRTIREDRDLDMAYVLMGWQTVPLSHPDLYPLDVFSHILSAGESSVLYRKLVEELGLAYTVTSYSHTPSYGPGVFAVSMTMDPANVDAAIDEVREAVYTFGTKKVSGRDLERAKKIKKAEFHMSRQDVESLASSLGTSEISTGNPDFNETYTDNIQVVTPEQIRDAVNAYFRDDAMGVAILAPPTEEQVTEEKAEAAEVGDIVRHELDNGLTVLVKENHTNPIITIGSYTLAGVRVEPIEKNGLANFVASMMPRGTKRMSGERIAETFDAMGAEYSCTANHTRIESELTVLAEDFDDGLRIFADILMHPKFDEDEMAKERQLIQAAIISRGDNWTTDAMDRMLIELFRKHPNGHPSVGSLETVAGITREDLIDHHRRFVRPDDTVITVFGDIEAAEAVEAVKEAFGRWEMTSSDGPAPVVEPPRTEPTTLTSYHDRAQAVIFRGYHGMPYSSDDKYAVDVLDAIMSGIYYPGGWLHTDLRGKGLVYVVHAYNWTGLDAGYFGIYAATHDEAVEQAIDIIDGYVEKIRTEPVTDHELDEAKQLCIIMHETQQQTNAIQASNAAIPELYGLGHDFDESYVDMISAVTKEEVMEMAKKYLENPVTIIRRPRPEEEHAASDE